MNRVSSVRDVTAIVRSATPTPPMELLFLCGHKAKREGGEIRRIKGIGEVLLRCPNCNNTKQGE